MHGTGGVCVSAPPSLHPYGMWGAQPQNLPKPSRPWHGSWGSPAGGCGSWWRGGDYQGGGFGCRSAFPTRLGLSGKGSGAGAGFLPRSPCAPRPLPALGAGPGGGKCRKIGVHGGVGWPWATPIPLFYGAEQAAPFSGVPGLSPCKVWRAGGGNWDQWQTGCVEIGTGGCGMPRPPRGPPVPGGC